jgi:hypothetical protein
VAVIYVYFLDAEMMVLNAQAATADQAKRIGMGLYELLLDLATGTGVFQVGGKGVPPGAAGAAAQAAKAAAKLAALVILAKANVGLDSLNFIKTDDGQESAFVRAFKDQGLAVPTEAQIKAGEVPPAPAAPAGAGPGGALTVEQAQALAANNQLVSALKNASQATLAASGATASADGFFDPSTKIQELLKGPLPTIAKQLLELIKEKALLDAAIAEGAPDGVSDPPGLNFTQKIANHAARTKRIQLALSLIKKLNHATLQEVKDAALSLYATIKNAYPWP